ncbi:MAG: hypothetical protein AB7C95_00960 [Synergistaceae bacterium]
MAESPNLGITHVATNQANKEVTINDGFTNIDKAITDVFAVNMASADAVLAIADLQRAITIAITNPGAGHTLTVAATKRLFIVHNKDATNSVDIVVGATSVTIAAETLAMLYMDGTTNGLWAVASGSGGGEITFLALTDTPGAYTANFVVAVNAGGTALTFIDPSTLGGGGGATTFLALTDTPSAFTGASTYLVRVNATGDALEFVDVSTLGLLSGTSYAVPFKGAVLSPASLSTQDYSSWTEVLAWGTPTIDTDSFYNGTNPGRLYVPAGVSKVSLKAALYLSDLTSDVSTAARIEMYDASAGTTKSVAYMNNNIASANQGYSLETSTIDVEEGDYFYCSATTPGDTSITVNASSSSFFQITVEELATAEGRPYDLAFFTSGLPSAAALVFQHVAGRAFDVPATAENNSQGYALTATTASASFTLTKNGISFGTMDFAAAGQVATFTVATATSFAVGDVLGIVAPSSQDATLADISATLLVNLT